MGARDRSCHAKILRGGIISFIHDIRYQPEGFTAYSREVEHSDTPGMESLRLTPKGSQNPAVLLTSTTPSGLIRFAIIPGVSLCLTPGYWL
jgi:hypothetical protein